MDKCRHSKQTNVPLIDSKSNGGRITNSPPPNVSSWAPEEIKALASNVDALSLSVDVYWDDAPFFDYLTEKKVLAKKNGNDIPFTITNAFTENDFILISKAHDSNGYEWPVHNSMR